MERIEFLTAGDTAAVEQMKKIWRECFDAEDAYLDRYFSLRYQPEQTLVYREDEAVLGMLTILPCTYRAVCGEKIKEYQGGYLFAVATLPQAQGRGISTKLLSYADEAMKAQGKDLALLAPAEPRLYSFYQKRGYETWFMKRQMTFPPVENIAAGNFSLKALSADEYYEQHRRLLPQDAVLWEKQAMPFAAAESELYHGGLYALMEGNQQKAICNFYRYKKEEVIAKEFLTEQGEDEQRLVHALRGLFPDARLTVRLPAVKNETGFDQPLSPTGMIRFYTQREDRPQRTQQAYCPFILD